ncbi:MAG: C40 family peptidase [Flavobacteriaceae bacterium]|nr:C40 family peptidase [Flavobacteriaceae bacterium]
MRTALLLCLILFSFSSCKSARHTKAVTKKGSKVITSDNSKADDIVNYAQQFEGVRYKYGGTTKKGMDCSGLIHTSYKSNAVLLPRTTKDLSTSGSWVDLKEVKKGDLLFFATKKNSRKVNHVGIVTDINKDDVEFIHASTSKGVITSNLKERYWYFAFVQARRVL